MRQPSTHSLSSNDLRDRLPVQIPSASTRMTISSREIPVRLQPTPTFSFADELAADTRARAPRGRSGGALMLLFLMALAGSGGYLDAAGGSATTRPRGAHFPSPSSIGTPTREPYSVHEPS